MKKTKKGTILSILLVVILSVLFLTFVFVAFFGGDGKIKVAIEKLASVIKGVPEIDQTRAEKTYFQNTDTQVKLTEKWSKKISEAMKDQGKKSCIMELENIEEESFYVGDRNYFILIQQKDANVVITLGNYNKQSNDENTEKQIAQLKQYTFEGVQLCVIKDGAVGEKSIDGATQFYDEFNNREITEKDQQPDFNKIKPYPVNALLISSGINEKNKYERKIGLINSNPDKVLSLKELLNENNYEWADFFKSDGETKIYAVKLGYGNGGNSNAKYLCFFPTYDRSEMEFNADCSNIDGGLMDLDCFDSSGDTKQSLKYNLNKGILKKDDVMCKEPTIQNN